MSEDEELEQYLVGLARRAREHGIHRDRKKEEGE